MADVKLNIDQWKEFAEAVAANGGGVFTHG